MGPYCPTSIFISGPIQPWPRTSSPRVDDEHDATVKAAFAVLGTASDVGKSLVAAGLCRLLADAGGDVVPFKAQNIADPAGVTRDGPGNPPAQILQALAAPPRPLPPPGP